MSERNASNMDALDMDGSTFDSELYLQKILKVRSPHIYLSL